MLRALVGLFALLVILPAPTVGATRNVGKQVAMRKKKSPPGPPLPPPAFDLRSIELNSSLGTAQVVVEVRGTSRPPESRLFTFSDARGRRFLPSLMHCEPQPVGLGHPAPGQLSAMAGGVLPPPPTGAWRCTLEVPRIYQRAPLVGISVEIRGRVLHIAGDRVQAAWAEARAATPLPPSERPRQPGTPWPPARRAPDGGTAPDSDAVDSELEE